MRKTMLLLALILGGLRAAGNNLPQFSTDGSETWYYIVFTTNSTVVQDTGADKELRNRAASEEEAGQLWKLEGGKDGCTLTSKSGRKLFFKKADNRFYASTGDATRMKIVAADGDKWELQVLDPSLAPSANPDAVAMVMNGGSGTDKHLDLWKHNFGACALSFIAEDKMEFPYQAAPPAPAEVTVKSSAPAPSEPLSLWYRRPAANWVREALPIGNGDMGAMVFGGIAQERVQFNHKTLWKGSSGASDLGSYLPFGDLYITDANAKAASDYRRSLNLRTAVADVQYTSDGGKYTREYLCSHPDGVLAIRYRAEGGTPLSLDLKLISAQGKRAVYTQDGATFCGKLSNGMNYFAAMAVEVTGGETTYSNKGVAVDGAREVVVFLTCETDFDPARDNHLTGDAAALAENAGSRLRAAKGKGFDLVAERHKSDYAGLFSRVDFTLGNAENAYPTNLLLSQTKASAKSMVDLLAFQYGRYLTIAASRGISVPSNLQGIWNKDGYSEGGAVWASDIHANINVQMNYWPAEPTNLSECHLPFLNYIRNEALREGGQWQKNARSLGADKGWVVNTAGNIFGGSGDYKVGKYSVANAWFCTHLWQHFAYTRDTTFLRATAMPVMKAACDFWMERLVGAQNGDGSFECPNEYSPEQGKVQNATAHAQQLVTQLFEETLQAVSVLGLKDAGCDEAFVEKVEDKLSKIDKGLRVDKDGLLREWKYQENTPNLSADKDHFANDEENVWKGHRHTSHLVALYPGFNIDPGIDRDIFAAAVKSLDDRGDVATGWARAWRISLWARARNSARAYATLRGFAHRTTSIDYDWHGGLYDNLLDAHATSVFQIEGNYGATAGIAEMLLQSRPDSLVLLPALPKEWADGRIKGLKAIGNFEVEMAWAAGRLTALRVRSLAGMPLTLAYPGIGNATITAVAGDSPAVGGQQGGNRLSFNTKKGAEYLISFLGGGTGIPQPAKAGNTEELARVAGRRILPNRAEGAAVYDTAGRGQSFGAEVPPGIYIVKAGKNTRKLLVK